MQIFISNNLQYCLQICSFRHNFFWLLRVICCKEYCIIYIRMKNNNYELWSQTEHFYFAHTINISYINTALIMSQFITSTKRTSCQYRFQITDWTIYLGQTVLIMYNYIKINCISQATEYQKSILFQLMLADEYIKIVYQITNFRAEHFLLFISFYHESLYIFLNNV